jgi:hypothetical protein
MATMLLFTGCGLGAERSGFIDKWQATGWYGAALTSCQDDGLSWQPLEG